MLAMSARLAAAAGLALVMGLAACTPAEKAPAADVEAVTQSELTFSEMRATPTPGGASVSAGYFTVSNFKYETDRLVGASCPRAGRVELHSMEMDGDVMRMHAVEAVDIPPGGTVEFAPGGLHLMLIDLPTPLTEGESVPVTLTFAVAGDVTLTFPVTRVEGGAAQ